MSALYNLLLHLDRELPQVIAESLFEAGSALSADAAMLMEVQNNSTLFVAYSSDPSLLGETIPWVRSVGPGISHIAHRMLTALSLRDAVGCRLDTGSREWLLVFGSRENRIDQALFDEYEGRLKDLFAALLRKRDLDAAQTANVDHLTGLPDRWATMRRIAEAVVSSQRNNTRAAVLFVDVNDFKEINDTLGHGQGDKVLRGIATRMRSALRANEFVGRIGGDEFAVVLSPIKSTDDAEAVAQRLFDGAQERTEDWNWPVSLGIGIAYYPDQAGDQDEWLHHADVAMYRAKRMRLPYCVYDKSWAAEKPSAVTPIVTPERAYEQQFLLCFQPIFDVETGRVAAAEALVRLIHPQDGVLSAARAISAAGPAEKLNLDMWVVRKALSYAKEWHGHGVGRVHVNLGEHTDAMYHGLLQTLTSTGIDPQLLAIELAANGENNEEQLARFVGLVNSTGATVGIDDFAARPLDLRWIENLGINFIKLSRAMLPSAGVSGRGVEAIVALSNVMGWKTIATRVASSDDRRIIRMAGVHYMQGFAFAQPMTAIDFQNWIEGSPRAGAL